MINRIEVISYSCVIRDTKCEYTVEDNHKFHLQIYGPYRGASFSNDEIDELIKFIEEIKALRDNSSKNIVEQEVKEEKEDAGFYTWLKKMQVINK